MQGLRQELRLRQEMTLQPQQILRSELIQMPLLELELRIKSEMEQNPFLEETENSEDSQDSTEVEERLKEVKTKSESMSEDDQPAAEKPEQAKEVEWEDILNDSEHWEYRPKNKVHIDINIDLPQPHEPTLSDHLVEQLRLESSSQDEIIVGEEIIGNINRDGYLWCSLEEIAESTGKPIELVEKVHLTIKEYEPLGIASRDLRECLLTQLYNRRPPAPVSERMLDEFWKDFINKRFEVLADKLEVEIGDIKEAFSVISKLNPKPGEGYFDERQNHVIPDLIVVKVSGEFEVFLNDGDIPNFKINNAYREMYMNRRKSEKNVRDFLSRKLESARWFINAIHQRRTTMIRTMRAIIKQQIEYFEYGPSKLKPMILADIAVDIGMDISTISRVTNGKYVQTDWGILELKYFFSEKMETNDGEEVSNRVIKAKLKEVIEAENKQKPFSDQQLTDILNEEGFQIRRRTVAKYREQLRLPIKRLRREI